MTTEKFKSLTLKQLKELIEEKNADENQEIRVWVEQTNSDGNFYLEGRRLIGVLNDPNDSYFCLVAGQYKTEEEEEA